jgi:hypothetical protein
VEREEFVNAGVIVSCQERDYLVAAFDLDEARLKALDPHADVLAIHRHLAGITLLCEGGAQAGAIGRLTRRERFHWLVAPRSTMIQISAVHTGHCTDLERTTQHLLNVMVRAPALVCDPISI